MSVLTSVITFVLRYRDGIEDLFMRGAGADDRHHAGYVHLVMVANRSQELFEEILVVCCILSESVWTGDVSVLEVFATSVASIPGNISLQSCRPREILELPGTYFAYKEP